MTPEISCAAERSAASEMGIADGEAIAEANPNHQANVIAGLSKLTNFLADLGAIDDPDAWAEFGLISRA